MKAFTAHQRELILNAMTSVIWTKSAMLELLSECNVDEQILHQFRGAEANANLTKKTMLRQVFGILSNRADLGTPIYRHMVERLINWQDFTSYWFTVDPKLNADTARTHVNALRNSLGMEPAHVPKTTGQPEHSESVRIRPDMSELRERFQALVSGPSPSFTPQQRGFEFETFLMDLFREHDVEVRKPFRTHGLQIDGSFKFESNHYLLEAKWTSAAECATSLYEFKGKVERNLGGRGLFISINGFAAHTVSNVQTSGAHTILMADGEDIQYVLDERVSLMRMLEHKIEAATTHAHIYYDVVRCQAKQL